MNAKALQYFDSLDKDQHAAAIEAEGSQLVEAAPGSGKTRTLIAKTLAEAEDRRPVYVFTFTTGAAEEIQTRLNDLRDPDDKNNWRTPGIRHVGTLHSWCLSFIRSVGCKSELIDDDGLAQVAEEVNTRLRLKVPAKRQAQLIAGLPASCYNETQFRTAHFKSMQENGLLSYDGLLKLARDYLRLAPPRWATKPVVCVDEVQDSSRDDLAIYEAFEAAGAELWMVGDLQQAIYSFRHHEPADVWQWWYGREISALSTNYRSSRAVVQALNLINMPFKPRVDIEPRPEAPKGDVTLSTVPTEAGLLENLSTHLLSLRTMGAKAAEVAVLCRTNKECELVSNSLKGKGFNVREKKHALPAVPELLWAALGLFRQPGSDWMAKRYLRAMGADAEAAQRNAIKHQKSIGQTLYPTLFAIDRLPAEWEKWADIMQVPKVQQGWFLERMADDWRERLEWDDIVMRLFEAPKEQEEGDGITVTTIHSAKGREWRHVIMPFCDQMSYRPKNGLEEERVFFVGASRAIETLTFYFARERVEEWKGGTIDVAMCQPLERVVVGSKSFKQQRRKRK